MVPKEGSSITDARGNKLSRMEQRHKGVRVWGENPIVTSYASSPEGMLADVPSYTTGTLLSGIAADLPSPQARYSEDDVWNLLRKKGTQVDKAEHKAIEQVITVIDQRSGRAQRVYLASLYISTPNPTRPHFIVDAETLKVHDQWEGLTTLNMTGPGGNEKVGQYEYGRDYPAFEVGQDCSFENANVKTVDMLNGTQPLDTAFRPPSCLNNGTARNTVRSVNGAFSPLNDAHAFGNSVFNMYNEWLGKRPIQQKLTLRVHFGQDWTNAQWTGQAMNFGDGGRKYYPLVSLDIIAHEVSHGFTEQNAELVYTGQAGGMNEAFSDMAAAAAEVYVRGRTDFILGDEVVRDGTNNSTRYMLDPERNGHAISHASKYYSGMNSHNSSGVYNKAFALLANKPGWDVKKAFTTFATANMLYWKPQSTFDEGACGVIRAADDRGMSRADVIDVFDQVGVRCPNFPPTTGGGGGGSASKYDRSIKYKQGDIVDVNGKRYALTVRVNNQPGGDYQIWGAYCDPTTCGENNSYTYGGWLKAYWADAGSSGGTTGGGGTTASGNFDEYRQYRRGEQVQFNGRSYTLTVKVDGTRSGNYPIYGSTCAPSRCTSSQPWVNADGRASAYWE
ncbi:M4 family metallopeptidase [Chitinimonas sp. BJB300]|uniref:M4 family metallopeptidase n=1 Tax=Chitinimonas sp. BJB300 TaxID=1559339 RepID=UPI001C913A3F|nr:M4 family metallopeptidase [Chitinimonas sp. BJB300]